MRFVILLSSLCIAESINPEYNKIAAQEYAGTMAIIILILIGMDIVDFFRKGDQTK